MATLPKADVLLAHRALAGAVFHDLPDAVVLTTPALEIVLANPAVRRLFDHAPEDLVGQPAAALYADGEELARHLRLATDCGTTGAARCLRRNGTAFDAQATWAAVRDAPGDVIAWLGIVRDGAGLISSERLAEALGALDAARVEVERLATTDELTGLLNRRALMELGKREFARACRYGHPLAVLALDVDFLKHVNDDHGDAAGDEVLAEVARACRGCVRDVDGVGRIGGEEFAVVLLETLQENAMEVAERIRAAIAALEPVAEVRVTVSVGVAGLRDEDDDFEALLARSDAALYWAKERGRNRVCLAPG